jgi:hypothetical protein
MDVEKTIQFLLEQQARFDARQAQFDERMVRIENVLQDVAVAQQNTNAILVTLIERHVALAESHEALLRAQAATEQRLNSLAKSHEALAETLAQAQAVTEQRLNSLAKSHEALAAAQRETQLSLRALIVNVDRHITSHN